MSYYDKILSLFNDYLKDNKISLELETDMHEASMNENSSEETNYLYTSSRKLKVISMDKLSQYGYRVINGISGTKRSLNTVDAFFIDNNNYWYFIEFKDCKLRSKKDNIEKKGMANWLLLLDVFYSLGAEKCKDIIDLGNPVQFAKDHVIYIVVCSAEKDPYTYQEVKNCSLLGEYYTPECLYKFKDYLFKDAFAFTEDFFEQKFTKAFKYV